jgi:DNA-binding NarL/FixJ family response regulator
LVTDQCGMKILLVDDHILFREGLASLLNNTEDMHVVAEVGTLYAAIEKSAEFKPDVVLIDVNLPDGSGIEAIEPISNIVPGVNIVILSVEMNEDLLFSAIRKGAKGFILKKTSLSDLLASIRALERGEAALSRAMTRQVLEEFARNGSQNNHHQENLEELTSREVEVLAHLSTGATNREIGERLFISENTVKVHLHNIFKKMDFYNRREAIRYAKSQGLGNGWAKDNT